MPQHEQAILTIDGLRLLAEKTGRYRPADELPEFRYSGKGELAAAVVFVWRLYDTWFRCPAIAFYGECAERTSDGSLASAWLDRPHLLLSECAEALALKKAFPSETSRRALDVTAIDVYQEPEKPPQAIVTPPPLPMRTEAKPAAQSLPDSGDDDPPSELEGGLGLDMISADDLLTLGKIADQAVAEKRAGRLSEKAVVRLRKLYDEAKVRIKSGTTEPLPGVK